MSLKNKVTLEISSSLRNDKVKPNFLPLSLRFQLESKILKRSKDTFRNPVPRKIDQPFPKFFACIPSLIALTNLPIILIELILNYTINDETILENDIKVIVDTIENIHGIKGLAWNRPSRVELPLCPAICSSKYWPRLG